MFPFSSNTSLGIDIGTTSIKAVELARKGTEIHLVNYGILFTWEHLSKATGAIQTSSLRFLEPTVSHLLKTLTKKMRTHANRVVASLPAFSVFTTLIELPKMPPDEAAQAIPFQSRQYIPAPLSTVTIEWAPIGERTTKENVEYDQFLVSSTPNEIIEKYTSVFKKANLPLHALEVESAALARALTYEIDTPSLLIDIGSRSTTFTIARRGELLFVSQTDFSGASLTQVLSQGLGVPPARAEKIKVAHGLLGGGGEQELSTILKPILDVILNEAKRAAGEFNKSFGKSITRIVLTGGSSMLLGLKEYIERDFGMEVSFGDPFKGIVIPKELMRKKHELGSELAIATGLALRSV